MHCKINGLVLLDGLSFKPCVIVWLLLLLKRESTSSLIALKARNVTTIVVSRFYFLVFTLTNFHVYKAFCMIYVLSIYCEIVIHYPLSKLSFVLLKFPFFVLNCHLSLYNKSKRYRSSI